MDKEKPEDKKITAEPPLAEDYGFDLKPFSRDWKIASQKILIRELGCRQ